MYERIRVVEPLRPDTMLSPDTLLVPAGVVVADLLTLPDAANQAANAAAEHGVDQAVHDTRKELPGHRSLAWGLVLLAAVAVRVAFGVVATRRLGRR